MELDLFDAIRLRIVLEINFDGHVHKVEPYEIRVRDGKAVLYGFDLTGPEVGWKELFDWEDWQFTRVRFEDRTRKQI